MHMMAGTGGQLLLPLARSQLVPCLVSIAGFVKNFDGQDTLRGYKKVRHS